MVIFHSYVSLPEGSECTHLGFPPYKHLGPHGPTLERCELRLWKFHGIFTNSVGLIQDTRPGND